jgi:hypothetical protein
MKARRGAAHFHRTHWLPRAAEKGNDRKDQKDDEQDLGDTGGGAGNASETQYGGDDRDNQKNQCVVKHGGVLLNGSKSGARGKPRLRVRRWGPSFTHSRRHASVKTFHGHVHAAPTFGSMSVATPINPLLETVSTAERRWLKHLDLPFGISMPCVLEKA